MKDTPQNTPVGVVIGRFQVPELHDGHHHLIRHARDRHEHLLIIVGSRKSFPTPRNPLSFAMRQAMLLAEFPNAVVVDMHDHPSDDEWSTRIDELIADLYPGMDAVLYGSRDSFIPFYNGTCPTVEVSAIPCDSGTDLRNQIRDELIHTPDFRRGIIHSHVTRSGIPYPTVDIAIINPESDSVLLGQKSTDGNKHRFIGGFYDPEFDTSLESAARREVHEETGGIEAGNFRYIGSEKVNDWRYQGSPDCVITTLFRADYISGIPQASDDIQSFKWFNLSMIPEILVPEHRSLGEMFIQSLN